MEKPVQSKVSFKLEMFVTDLSASIDFYNRILKFKVSEQKSDGYTPLTNGDIHLSLNLYANLPDDHPVKAVGDERLGRGIELVLVVDNIGAMYKHVIAQNWPLSSELARRPWGETDFRILDPNGYYWRITTVSNRTHGTEEV